MVHDEAIGDERHRHFGHLLREARKSIPVDIGSLGNTVRLPNRVGKPVTQKEVAEAIGVSRVWYSTLEAGQPIRASVALLNRICEALELDEQQRSTVFQLGVPELSSRALESAVSPLLEAYARVRSSVKRLWSASTPQDVLAIVAEEASCHFACADLIFFVQRVAEGQWHYPYALDRGMGKRNAEMFADLASSLTPAAFDEIALYPVLSQPGDVGSRDTFKLTSVGNAYERALAKYKLTRSTFLHARIRSQSGIIAGITVKHARQRDYCESDRAFISTIASLASLALS